MANATKPGQYSPVSLEAARLIARSGSDCRSRLLVAYLALARHASMRDEGGLGCNRVTGAGAQKIAAALGCKWLIAKMLEMDLRAMGLIEPAPRGVGAGRMGQGRWLLQHAGTVNLPHALVDGLGAATGIKRLLTAEEPEPVVVCAILLLLELYAQHDLEAWGGVDPQLLWREWKRPQVRTEGKATG